MIEENAKRDIVQIIKLSRKYNHQDIRIAGKLLELQERPAVLKSSFGKRYFQRLEDISCGNVHDKKCVICCKNEASDGVVCEMCASRLPLAAEHRTAIEKSGDQAEQPVNLGNDAIKSTIHFADEKVHQLAEKVNVLAGGEGKVDLHMRDLFKDVFKRHLAEEAENIFICGTKTTTPSAEHISSEWPKPWLYSRVLLYLFAAFYILLLCWTGFQNSNVIPGIMVLGSCMFPVAVLVFFFEMNAPRNISIFTVVKNILFGRMRLSFGNTYFV